MLLRVDDINQLHGGIMTDKLFDVHVERVNEGKHKDAEFDTTAVSVTVSEDGQLLIKGQDGRSQSLGATTWGSVTITRVKRVS